MPSVTGHKSTPSVTQNHKAHLTNAYNELGKELSSSKIKVVGNYNLGKVIGEGAYGKVRMGTHRITATRVAIKQIPKSMSAALTREIHHHRQLHHPHVTQMYEVIATESSIWLVSELCSGGELFDYLAEKGRLSEDEARIIFGQLCLAVAYLHEKAIVHRDLKLENILLDERCRVKLGDFGFTREFERGSFMETFCGTTGYASPEMLQGKRYVGPEVDVWSLGVILYCLLTGTLPFDDDDEFAMKQMIIKGDFDCPEWLSEEAQDMIANILQKDTAKRLTIPQILSHPWFKARPHPQPSPSAPQLAAHQPVPSSPVDVFTTQSSESHRSSQTSNSDSALFHTPLSDSDNSAPTTPDENSNQDHSELMAKREETVAIHPNPSQTTIKNQASTESDGPNPLKQKAGKAKPVPETVLEEEGLQEDSNVFKFPPSRSSSLSSKTPYPARTPARTKRRSISSNLSVPPSPTTVVDKTPLPPSASQDFAYLLTTPTPIIFSTPLERDLLNSLSMFGFDTGQIVHSVLSDACDSASALWWMLKRKAEKRQAEEQLHSAELSPEVVPKSLPPRRSSHNAGVQTEGLYGPQTLSSARSAPQLAFVPPTPTNVGSSSAFVNPPRPLTPTGTVSSSPTKSYLVTSPSSGVGESAALAKSNPSTPSGSLKDAKRGKARSGSVSIMQRATTALEAAGLVRKKSAELRDEKEEKDREETRHSHHTSGVSSSKGTKSPPLKAAKDGKVPGTPPPLQTSHSQPLPGSPWFITDAPPAALSGAATLSHLHQHHKPHPATPANSPGEQSLSVSPLGLAARGDGTVNRQVAPAPVARNRASLLTTFRLWFAEDKKGKRKETSLGGNNHNVRGDFANAAKSGSISRNSTYGRTSQVPTGGISGSGRGRGIGTVGKFARKGGGQQRPRHSVSSRRSSSVNSRRSSITSAQVPILESPHALTDQGMVRRLSYGSHTPNSEKGEYSSRPSSVRSFSMGQHRHRKSPSASSAGSVHHYRTTSPIARTHHRRAGSGSSTRVVRQVQRPSVHGRSNSTTSSAHSQPNSRPASWYEHSESERTGSPFRPHSRRSVDDSTPRRGTYGASSSGTTTFVAQKRTGPFASPMGSGASSAGKSSWKKSWGLEPPGWQTRTTTHVPVEVLTISPGDPAAIRDVFSGRVSLSTGDDDEWVDEDDEEPLFAPGFGQTVYLGGDSSGDIKAGVEGSTITLSPVPRQPQRKPQAQKRAGQGTGGGVGRRKPSPDRVSSSPVESGYDAPDPRGGRRQLPSGRSGPAFKQAIQEEDEEEE